MVFDPCLTWDDHVKTITRKCFGILIDLSHVRQHLPADTVVTIVNALVLSHVRYCLPVYGNCTKKNLGRIDKVINFVARVISGRRKYDHVADVRDVLDVLSVLLAGDVERNPGPTACGGCRGNVGSSSVRCDTCGL